MVEIKWPVCVLASVIFISLGILAFHFDGSYLAMTFAIGAGVLASVGLGAGLNMLGMKVTLSNENEKPKL